MISAHKGQQSSWNGKGQKGKRNYGHKGKSRGRTDISPAITPALMPTFTKTLPGLKQTASILIPMVRQFVGCVVFCDGDSALAPSSFTEALSAPSPLSQASSRPTYMHPAVEIRAPFCQTDLPSIFQIEINYEPYCYAPFPVMISANMTIRELLIMLISLLNTQRIFLFLFYDYRMCKYRQTISNIRELIPGSTLHLVHWDYQDVM